MKLSSCCPDSRTPTPEPGAEPSSPSRPITQQPATLPPPTSNPPSRSNTVPDVTAGTDEGAHEPRNHASATPSRSGTISQHSGASGPAAQSAPDVPAFEFQEATPEGSETSSVVQKQAWKKSIENYKSGAVEGPLAQGDRSNAIMRSPTPDLGLYNFTNRRDSFSSQPSNVAPSEVGDRPASSTGSAQSN
ncbi:hypothetical protein BJ508DRAFT_334826 [Ascobolus immersus RN42]|uniref:Uncharacterized protein n=1 Tax=Ascobolus immersus RN42 TaxID=1160509 RepID=A0A3N4HEN4_ASCIM|nr:hypothetical protein BJ508DRAFT_334826 [Ascobolus immersus RN42]